MPAQALLFGYALAALATAGANVGTPPPAEPQRVDTQQTITLPCLSVRVSNSVSVAVSEPLLQRYVAARPTGPGLREAYEQDRMARIWGDRAEALLRLDTDATDRHGCRSLPREHIADAQYLLGHVLQAGQAMVTVDGRGRPEAAIIITGENGCETRPMAIQSYRLENGTPFFHLVTCVV
jgi:hypothetical protein